MPVQLVVSQDCTSELIIVRLLLLQLMPQLSSISCVQVDIGVYTCIVGSSYVWITHAV